MLHIFDNGCVWRSIISAVLSLDLLDTVALIGVDLSKQRDASGKDEMRDRNDVRGAGVGSTDVQPTRDAAFVSHVEDARDVAAIGNGEIRGLLEQRRFEGLRQRGFKGE